MRKSQVDLGSRPTQFHLLHSDEAEEIHVIERYPAAPILMNQS